MNWRKTTFGYRLQMARLAAGISERQLADAAGVHRSTLRQWETRMTVPPKRDKETQVLAELLNVSVEFLVTGNGEGPPVLPEYETWRNMLEESWQYMDKQSIEMLGSIIRMTIDRARQAQGLPPLPPLKG